MAAEFKILGPLEVWTGGEQVRLSGTGQRKVLAALLLSAITELRMRMFSQFAPEVSGSETLRPLKWMAELMIELNDVDGRSATPVPNPETLVF